MTYPPPTPPKKTNTGLIIGIILGVVVLVCVGCVGATYAFGLWASNKATEIVENLPTDFPTPPAEGPAGSHTVRYEIEGSGEAFINWARGTGGQDSETTDLPWNKEITVNADNFGVIVSAVPRGKDVTIKSCRILIDGTERRQADAKNGFVQCAFTYVGNP